MKTYFFLSPVDDGTDMYDTLAEAAADFEESIKLAEADGDEYTEFTCCHVVDAKGKQWYAVRLGQHDEGTHTDLSGAKAFLVDGGDAFFDDYATYVSRDKYAERTLDSETGDVVYSITLRKIALRTDSDNLIADSEFEFSDGSTAAHETHNCAANLRSLRDYGGTSASDEHAEIFDTLTARALCDEFDSVEEAMTAAHARQTLNF